MKRSRIWRISSETPTHTSWSTQWPSQWSCSPMTVVSGPSTAARISASVISLGRAREHVAAADAALRAHEARALHREQDLLEVRLGEVRALGDLLHRRRPVRLVQREREQRPRGVVAPRRHLHPRSWSRSRRSRDRPSRPVTARDRRAQAGSLRPVARPGAGATRLRRRRRSGTSSRRCSAPATAAVAARSRSPARATRRAARARRPRLGRARAHRDAAAEPRGARRAGRSRPSCRRRPRPRSTSITTGLAPSQHGIVGFRMRRRRRRCSTCSRGRGRHGARPTRRSCSATPPFLRPRRCRSSRRREFRRSGFTEAHLRGARFFGWQHAVVARRALPPARRGRRAVRLRVLPGRRQGRARARAARRLLRGRARGRRPARRRPARRAARRRARCVVTADHGQVHLEPDGVARRSARVDELVDACCGRRALPLPARAPGRGRGAARRRARRARRRTRGCARATSCSTRAGSARRRRRRRGAGVGDVVLAARDAVAFVDPALPREASLRSAPRLAHGRRDAGPAPRRPRRR